MFTWTKKTAEKLVEQVELSKSTYFIIVCSWNTSKNRKVVVVIKEILTITFLLFWFLEIFFELPNAEQKE